jgi:hypothetical protein
MNYIGNVMGTNDAQTNYQQINKQTTAYIWSLDKGSENKTGVQPDSLVHQSLLRWGNYDVVTGAARWCGNSSSPGWSTICNSSSEIPTAGLKFIKGNPVPSSTALPSSFYLSAQPSFWATPWGTPPWPAIGPDVTNGTAPDEASGHSYAIPAQLCYLNTSVDPAYQQTSLNILHFNAAKCYPGAYGRDWSPMNLRAVVH